MGALIPAKAKSRFFWNFVNVSGRPNAKCKFTGHHTSPRFAAPGSWLRIDTEMTDARKICALHQRRRGGAWSKNSSQARAEQGPRGVPATTRRKCPLEKSNTSPLTARTLFTARSTRANLARRFPSRAAITKQLSNQVAPCVC